MEHCANQFPGWFWHKDFGAPQAGALGCRSGHHWIIEHNTIRFIKSVGIDFGGEGARDPEGWPAPDQKTAKIGEGHVFRSNVVSDCGTCGIAGAGSIAVRIVGNIVERNGQASNGAKNGCAERAGIKVHHFSDGVIEGNWVDGLVHRMPRFAARHPRWRSRYWPASRDASRDRGRASSRSRRGHGSRQHSSRRSCPQDR